MPERLTHKKSTKHGAMYAMGMHGGGGASSHPAHKIATHGGKHGVRHGKAGHVVHQAPMASRKVHPDKSGTSGYKRGKKG